MKNNTVITSSLSPNYCEVSPIHIPGSIQPHGVLLVLGEPNLEVLQVSENTVEYLDLEPEDLLNRPVQQLMDEQQWQQFQWSLGREDLAAINPLKLRLKGSKGKILNFDGIVHRNQGILILELEPTNDENTFTFLNFYHIVKSAAAKLHAASSFNELCQTTVKEIRGITGFDRILVYQFNEDGNGSVIAEAKEESLEPWLNLHYPATDIPPPARVIFEKNWLRLIPDVDYTPVPLIPANYPLTNEPLDLSFTGLRSVAPCHLQYLQNMGVKTTLTLSLIRDEQLWGLIACHHHQSTPKYLPYEVRAACEFLAQALSSELSAKEDVEDYDYQLSLKSIHNRLIQGMSESDRFVEGLQKSQSDLLNLVSATGVALCLEGEITALGLTPPIEEIKAIATWLEGKFENKLFATHFLAKLIPNVANFKNVASGLLAIAISESQKKYILWFRPEVLQTVTWAGNPYSETQTSLLSPRNSFEEWKELVYLTALPWKKCEIEAAIELRKSMISIILKKADELAELNAKLTVTLQQLKQNQTQMIQNEKMSSLGQMVAGIAHEINNPVNFIYGNLAHAGEYIRDLLEIVELYQKNYPNPHREIQDKIEEVELDFLAEDLPKLFSSMSVGATRIREIVQSLRNFSRLDESEKKAVDIHEGINSTLLLLGNRLKFKSERPTIQVTKDYANLPLVECYPSQLNQVFMNLLANALDALEERDRTRSKAEQKANPSTIEIHTARRDNWAIVKIKDNGPGFSSEVKHKLFDPFFTTKSVGKGTGMGLAISHQIIVEKHGGKLYCQSTPEAGTEFVIEIPITM